MGELFDQALDRVFGDWAPDDGDAPLPVGGHLPFSQHTAGQGSHMQLSQGMRVFSQQQGMGDLSQHLMGAGFSQHQGLGSFARQQQQQQGGGGFPFSNIALAAGVHDVATQYSI